MKRWCALLARAAAPALASASAPAYGQTTGAFAGIPHVAFHHYAVAGADAAALRRSIDAARPTDPHDDAPVDALTHWAMRWSWHARPRGRCDLSRARLTFRATVTLPRLADTAALPSPLIEAWTGYIAALERHEAAHVRYAYDHRGGVLAAIRAATCATADRAGRRALAAIADHDIAYDRDTRHGLSEGAGFP